MHPFYQEYLERLTALHQELLDSIEGLPPAALDWTPIAETNTINVLVTHITGAERYWIGDVVLGELSGRVRESEFQVSGTTQEELTSKINAATAYAHSAVTKLRLEYLAVTRISPRDGRTFTVAWGLLHALEHTAIHLGHIQITWQLWKIQVQS